MKNLSRNIQIFTLIIALLVFQTRPILADDVPNPSPSLTPTVSPDTQTTPTETLTPSPTPTTVSDLTGGQTADSSDPAITTDTSTASGVIINTGNQNITTPTTTDATGSAQVNDNGDGSGTSTENVSSADDTTQNNNATITATLSEQADSGQNTVSNNPNVSASITTGNADVSGTIITGVNTNANNVAVSEFNVNDNQTGDIVLDLSGGHCIANCLQPNTSVTNANNQPNATNSATLVQVDSSSISQTNTATIESTLSLSANTGNNQANANDSANISTGNANVSASIVTLANTNISSTGGVQFVTVNIYGTLQGDIVLPDDALIATCASCVSETTTASDTNNGTGSTNTSDLINANNTSQQQDNTASISNTLATSATTGSNQTMDDNGNVTTITGDTTTSIKMVNVANTTVDGNIWLVIVNNAGQWFGQILGASAGSDIAGSNGMQLGEDANGSVTVTNNNNASSTQNTTDSSSVHDVTTNQSNTASINNTVTLSANTGNNQANANAGNAGIQTGSATIIANFFNFVNNNFSSPNSHLIVSVVNVFGSWFGNFVTPGHTSQHNQVSFPGPQLGGGNTRSNSDSSSVSPTPSTPVGQPTPTVVQIATNFSPISSQTPVVAEATNHTVIGTHVLSMMTNNEQPLQVQEEKHQVSINLAWGVIALPIFAILYGLYRLSRSIWLKK